MSFYILCLCCGEMVIIAWGGSKVCLAMLQGGGLDTTSLGLSSWKSGPNSKLFYPQFFCCGFSRKHTKFLPADPNEGS